MTYVRIIGAGLAGCEAALTLASFGIKVQLYEMKPNKKTPAQKLDTIAELVCSNSFRSNKNTNAVGLLKDEMMLLNGSLMKFALEAQVPAGDSLAVDRVVFSSLVEGAIKKNPLIELVQEEVCSLPLDGIPTIIATGPLTSDSLALSIVDFIGNDRLDFYDAIAPIVDTESIDFTQAFTQSRWQEGQDGDYINCPMDKETYEQFVAKLNTATKAKKHDFENAKYFEGCLPIEVMAERGLDTLRFGPLKPVGLFDPHKKERPYAVLQLRKEDVHGTAYNLVGCQTRMSIPEQKEAFGLIPALRNVEFLRFGSIHRNTYIDSPKVLDKYLRLMSKSGESSNIFLAGQISGVEGYVESMACGLLVAHILRQLIEKKEVNFFPLTTALGGLYGHILGLNRASVNLQYVPSNVTWSMITPIETSKKTSRAEKRQKLYERAIYDLKHFSNTLTTENERRLSL